MPRRLSHLGGAIALFLAPVGFLYHPFGATAARATRATRASSTIETNDNRAHAGTLAKGVLTVALEARTGTWYPEGPTGPSLEVAAWGEPGKPAETPGPLLRVPVGTELRVTLSNTLDRRLAVYGLGEHAMGDSVVLEAGATREVRFTARRPGTFYYFARSGAGRFGARFARDAQLNGALVVDSAGASAADAERIFMISWFSTLDSLSPSGIGKTLMAINGQSWPHTERVAMQQGDTVRWRVINVTEIPHPMHLHGFYFRVDARGDGIVDTSYASDQRRLAVTEALEPMQTMTMTWAPTRPGNWVWHCHFAMHISPDVALDAHGEHVAPAQLAAHQSDRPHQMFGLVLGLSVKPRAGWTADTRPARAMRMLVRDKPRVYGEYPGYAFVLDGTKDAANADAMPVPGPTLIMHRGERVAVTIVNRSHDRAAIHWHGIELESFPDGVPGWSGAGNDVLPSIAPGDSLTVRFTTPRAGTFMYHSHFNERHQINGGLYGPLVVLEPGETWNPDTDRILMFTSKGATMNVVDGPAAPVLLNGEERPEPMTLDAGKRYRLRLIELTDDNPTTVALRQNGTPLEWRALAKDGAVLPASQATMRTARLQFFPGEIYDYELTPRTRGTMQLEFGNPDEPKRNVLVDVRVK